MTKISHEWINKLMLVVIAVSLLAIFSLFIILAFYTNPTADDFDYAISFQDPDFDSVFSVVVDWYRRWNPRYLSVTLIGTYSKYLDLVKHYKFLSLFLFGVWLLSAYFLLRTLFENSRRIVVAGAVLVLFVLYILTMPRVSSGFYWMNSAYQYQIGNVLLMSNLACMIRLARAKHQYLFAPMSATLLFAVIGTTEMYMVLMVILVTTITIYVFATGHRYRTIWSSLLVVTLLSAALLILAPGNEGRGRHFVERHQFLFSVTMSFQHLGGWVIKWLREPLLWLATMLYVICSSYVSLQTGFNQKINKVYFAIILPCWMLALFSCFFVAFWSMGVSLPDRAMNSVYLIFLAGWFALITVVLDDSKVIRRKLSEVLRKKSIGQTIGVIVAIGMFVGFLNNHNLTTAYTDLFDRAVLIDELYQTRYLVIAEAKAKSSKSTVNVPRIGLTDRPSTIMVDDITDDRNDWRNKAYANYFGIKAIKTSDYDFWGKSNLITVKGLKMATRSGYFNYVMNSPDLRKAWEKSDQDIDEFGKRHWYSHGSKENRTVTPYGDSNKPTLTLRMLPNSKIDRVGCANKDFTADGQPDLIFLINIDVPSSEGQVKAITHIKLQRAKPFGRYETNNQYSILGTSVGWSSPLINDKSGQIFIRNPNTSQPIWIFVCADGRESPESVYSAEANMYWILP